MRRSYSQEISDFRLPTADWNSHSGGLKNRQLEVDNRKLATFLTEEIP
jgi:hypothetical protein